MDIYLRNPSIPEFLVEKPTAKNGIKWSIKDQQITDSFRSRSSDLTLPRRVPARQFAEATFWNANQPYARCYVEQYEVDEARTKKLTLQGIEKQLEYRYTPDLFYPDGTTFAKLFADHFTLNHLPGLLALANGWIPPGWPFSFVDADNNTVRIEDCGTASRFAEKTLFFIGYQYVRGLSLVHDVEELASRDLTYYRTASDLYIRIDHDYSRGWYDHGYLLCEGVFDTGIRLGTCPTDALDGDLIVPCMENNIADVLTEVIRSHDYYLHWREESDHLYLDIDSEEGRDGPV